MVGKVTHSATTFISLVLYNMLFSRKVEHIDTTRIAGIKIKSHLVEVMLPRAQYINPQLMI